MSAGELTGVIGLAVVFLTQFGAIIYSYSGIKAELRAARLKLEEHIVSAEKRSQHMADQLGEHRQEVTTARVEVDAKIGEVAIKVARIEGLLNATKRP